MWEAVVVRLRAVLREQMALIGDPARFLELKRFVVLFAKTMETYGLHAAPLLEFLAASREQFEV
jgi:hypothetical protein